MGAKGAAKLQPKNALDGQSSIEARKKLSPLDEKTYLANGLNVTEVSQRLALGLANTQKSVSSRSISHILRSNLLTLFNAVVGLAFAILLIIGKWQDALFGIPVIINIAVGIGQEIRSKLALDRLSLITAPLARVRRDGKSQELAIEAIVVDDLLELKAGDQIVADAVILQSANLSVDESLVSGEAEPVSKVSGQDLISGSLVISGTALARVSRVGLETFSGKMTLEARRYSLANSEIRLALNRIILWISILLLPLAVIVSFGQIAAFGGWDKFSSGETRTDVLVSAIASIVSMVPQGLVLIASITFALAAIRLAKRDVLVQELPAVETLARVDVVCFDKTGTLTKSELTVQDLLLVESPQSTEFDSKVVLSHFGYDSDANQTVKALRTRLDQVQMRNYKKKVVFESSKRWSGFSFGTSIGQTESWILGAPEVLLDKAKFPEAVTKAEQLAFQGLRVLALCSTNEEIDSEEKLPSNLVPRMLISLTEAIREESKQTLNYFAEQGVSIRIISGDSPLTVASIARNCGLEQFGKEDQTEAFDASQLPENEDELAELLERQYVFGRVRPEQKQRMVAALQSRGHVVAMTGDGVNDALALKQADLGIAMGSGGPATKAIAKLVIVGGDFAAVPKIVAEGRRVIANLERVSSLFLTKTVWAMLLAIGFGLLSWKFAFVPRQITAMDIFIIGLPSFALALLPNSARYQAGFLKRTLKLSISIGLVIALAIYSLLSILITLNPNAQDSERSLQTSVILLLSIASLWLVNVLSRPLKSIRGFIVLGCYLVFIAIFVISPLSNFFGFLSPQPLELVWSLALGFVSCAAIELLYRFTKNQDARLRL